MDRAKNPHIRQIENLQEYVRDRAVRQAASYVKGKYYYGGKCFTEKEFNDLYPAKLKYRVLQMGDLLIKPKRK